MVYNYLKLLAAQAIVLDRVVLISLLLSVMVESAENEKFSSLQALVAEVIDLL